MQSESENMNEMSDRISQLSPAKRVLLEKVLRKKGTGLPSQKTIPRIESRESATISFPRKDSGSSTSSNMHHIIFDGWSERMFLRELATIYESFFTGNPNPLPDLPVQYADYAQWQRNWMKGNVLP